MIELTIGNFNSLDVLTGAVLNVEIGNTWSIEPAGEHMSNFATLKNNFNDLNMQKRFANVVYFSKPSPNDNAARETQLKLDISRPIYELFVSLDTKKLQFFQNIMANPIHYNKKFDPCVIKAMISIYYDDSKQSKILLKKVELKYLLGYAKVRTVEKYIRNEVDEEACLDNTSHRFDKSNNNKTMEKDSFDQ